MANPSGLSTGIDNTAQVNNAYILASWPTNPASDNVVSYELRIRKSAGDASGTATAVAALTMTDSTQNWSPSQWKGAIVIVGGSQALVSDNTATQLTLVDPGTGQGWSPSQPVAGTYTISHIATYRTGANSFRFPTLYQATSYALSIQAINNLGIASGWSAERSITTATDAVAPDPPSNFAALRTQGGAVLNWTGVDLTQAKNQDLRGYEIQVWVGAMAGGMQGLGQFLGGSTGDTFFTPSWQTVTPGGYLGTSFSYDAPRGTAPNTAINFRIRSIDWSGNVSAWVNPGPIQADGTYIDHLLAGTLKVYGKLSATGGFTTRQSDGNGNLSGAGYDILGKYLSANDGSSVDRGYGPGVTFKVDALTGGVSLAGDLRATGIIQAAAFIGDTSKPAPTYTAPATGFSIDPVGGFNWYSGGVLQATWAPNGQLTIYSGASIYAGTLASSSTTGNGATDSGFKISGTSVNIFSNGSNNSYYRMNFWTGTAYQETWRIREVDIQFGGFSALTQQNSLTNPYMTTRLMGAYAYNRGAVSIPAATATKVTGFTVLNSGMPASSWSNDRYTFGSGTNYPFYVMITARISFTTSFSRCFVSIYKNGTEMWRGPDGVGNGQTTAAAISVLGYVSPGDYLEMYVYCSSAATSETTSGADPTYFSVMALSHS